jgi:hypothetical protein
MIGSKKSQVTVFIIIGIIILFAVIFVSYLIYITTQNPERVLTPTQKKVDTYVTQCLEQVGNEALFLIGQQGGYYEIPEHQKKIAKLDPDNSEFLMMGDDNLYIPYWFYQTDGGFDDALMPVLQKEFDGDASIESQVERYIIDNIGGCLDNFSEFSTQGIDIEPLKDPKARIIFGDTNTFFKLEYPLSISLGEEESSLKDFQHSTKVGLRRIYDLAREIRNYEMQDVFLERTTQNLISLYSQVNDDYLPPMYGGLEFRDCSKEVFWFYNDVKSDLKEMLTFNMPYIKIRNAKYEPIEVDHPDSEVRKLMQGVFKSLEFTTSEVDYPTIDVDFNYLSDFPLDLDLGSFGILEPSSFDINLIFHQMCMFEYEFQYDVKYPVLITLVDDNSELNGQPYMFQYPIQVVLKDNFPRVRQTELTGIPAHRKTRGIDMCDMRFWTADGIDLEVKDVEGNYVEDDTAVFFQCGPRYIIDYDENGTMTNITRFADKCSVGATKDGKLKTNLPVCQGGSILSLENPGYLSKAIRLGDVLEGKPIKKTILMEKLVPIEIDVRKYFVKPPALEDETVDNPGVVEAENGVVKECNIYQPDKELTNYEQVFLRIEKMDTQNGDLRVPIIRVFSPYNGTDPIELAPGEYAGELLLIRKERFPGEMTIRKESQEKVIPGSIASDEKIIRYPDEDVVFDQMVTGGSIFSFTVERDDLRADNMTLYVFDMGRPTILERVGIGTKYREDCARLNPELVRPKFR